MNGFTIGTTQRLEVITTIRMGFSLKFELKTVIALNSKDTQEIKGTLKQRTLKELLIFRSLQICVNDRIGLLDLV